MNIRNVVQSYQIDKNALNAWLTKPVGAPNRNEGIKKESKALRDTTNELAKWLHDSYEQIANENNWNTQKACKVAYEELPPANKSTMFELAKRILNSK